MSVVLLTAVACSSGEPSGSTGTVAAPTQQSGVLDQLRELLSRVGVTRALEDPTERVRFETPYAPGAWRLADNSELRNVVLWFSHILIRHQDIRSKEVSFSRVGWRSMLASPERSRGVALELAKNLAVTARRDPNVFSSLAKQYSDDIATRERGGALGGVTAFNFLPWPQVLDALAALRPGDVSGVVETEYGFHVFHRTSRPEEQTVSGSRIVIGHDQAEFLAVVARRPLPQRSREQALALAEQVYADAATQPEQFEEQVAKYSEHMDAAVKGDLGQWSTWEPTDFRTQIAILSSLRVGDVARPVETLFGWEILRRTANRPRETYAMTAVELVAASPEDSAGVPKKAREFAEILRQHPERFAELQRKGCCTYIAQWPEGRGHPPLMDALSRLQIGEVGHAPIPMGMSYIIPKRVAPKPAPEVATHFELPVPSEPNIAALLASSTPQSISQEFRAIAEELCREVPLSSARCLLLQQLHDGAFEERPSGVGAAQDSLRRLRERLRLELGDALVVRHIELANTHFERILRPSDAALQPR